MWLKSGYGSAEIGLTSMEVMLQVYLLELYVSAGLKPLLAGSALAIAVVWDAVSDPIMGVITDRAPAKTARGKRLPFVGLGVALSVAAFAFLFSPESGANEPTLFWRLLGSYLILNTAMTLAIVPYLALINDLAKGAEERAEFFGWRLVFSGFGLIVGLSIPAALAHFSGEVIEPVNADLLASNRSESALWIGAVCVGTALLATAVIWESAGRTSALITSGGKAGIVSVLKSAWRSLGFRLVVGTFVFISLGRAVNASLALIFYKGTLALNEQEVTTALIGLSFTVIAATPVWVRLSKRFDKRKLCVFGSLALTALTAVVYPLMPPGEMGPVVFIVVAGGLAASSVVLLESLFSDVVEEDGERSRIALTGSYYGLWRMATKLARAGGLGVSGLFLAMIGYQEGSVAQDEAVYRSVAWAFGPGVAVFFGAGTWLIWRERVRFRRQGGF